MPMQTPALCARRLAAAIASSGDCLVGLSYVLQVSLHLQTPLSDLGEREVTPHVTVVCHCTGGGHGHQSTHRATAQQGWGHLQRMSANGWSSGKSPAGSGLMPAKGKTRGERMRGGQERVKRSRGCRGRRKQ